MTGNTARGEAYDVDVTDDGTLVELEVEAVELCSGREGDDAFARIERGNPAFLTLLDVVRYSIGNVDEEPDADEWLDEEVAP